VPESFVKSEDQYIRKNDILMSMANSKELVGKVSKVDRDDVRCTLGGFIAAIRCRGEILPEFLMILLRAPLTRERLIDSSTQTTNIANISLGRLRPLEIKLPPKDEQMKIVQRVGHLLNQCDELESLLLEHEKISTASRKSAVNAVSLAQTPEELQVAWKRLQENWTDLVRGLDGLDDLRDLILGIAFSGLLTRTSNFSLEGWESTTLGVLCDVRDGTHDSPKKATIGYPLVTSKNLKKGLVDLEHSYLISESDYQEISKRSRVDKYDVLISMIGTVGQVAIVKDQPEYAIKNVGLIKTGSELLSRFISYYLVSPQATSHINIASSGGVQKFLSLGKLRALPIKIPSPQIQEEIVLRLDQLMSFCEELEKNTIQANILADRLTQSVLANSR